MYSKENTLRKNDYRVGGYRENYKIECVTYSDYFYAVTDKAKYCSQRCQNDAYIKKRIQIKESEREKICPICNNPFHSKRKDTIYCSPKCKQKAYRSNVTNSSFVEIDTT